MQAFTTTRIGGVSQPPYAQWNLGAHCGDSAAAVAENRQRLQRLLPGPPLWLRQQHGTRVIQLPCRNAGQAADGAWSRQANQVCTVLTADCLPLLLSDHQGRAVAAIHCGWRGLAAGIIGQALAAMALEPSELHAWLGPAIGPANYQVGADVHRAFVDLQPQDGDAFQADGPGHWLMDIYRLARHQLLRLGVESVHGGGFCTYADRERFYSYRRDGQSGRMATVIWISP